jgi:hypothetical protein
MKDFHSLNRFHAPSRADSTGSNRVPGKSQSTVSKVKKFNICGQEFRTTLKRCDVMTDAVSGTGHLWMLSRMMVIG